MTRLSDVPGARCLRDVEVSGTGPFDSAAPGVLAFVMAAKYLVQAAENPHVSAVLAPPALADAALETGLGVAVADDPRAVFFGFHNALARTADAGLGAPEIDPDAGVSPLAVVSPGARIGPGAVVEPTAFIGPEVTLEEGAYVGTGALVGVAGHFEQWQDGRRVRVAHMGRVRVGPGAQILSGAMVQRDVYAVETLVGRDVVVGPGVRVAHGVNIGEGSSITGGSIVAGYTTIGARVWIGPGSTIGNNLTVGDGARVEIGSVVVKSLEPGARVSGNFARAHQQRLKEWARHGQN